MSLASSLLHLVLAAGGQCLVKCVIVWLCTRVVQVEDGSLDPTMVITHTMPLEQVRVRGGCLCCDPLFDQCGQ